MRIFIKEFMECLKGAKPETRFFFELLVARAACGDGDDEGYGIEALTQQFRLSQKLVSNALADLVRLGMMVQQSLMPVGKGRPAIRYVFSPAVIHALKASGPAYGIHVALLERIFSDAKIEVEVPGLQSRTVKERVKITKTGKPAPPGACKRLSACNRLLFATLLARADQCGVVSGLGGPELRKLTGFDSASLKHRLRRLMDLGLIRRYVPGISSSIFAKSKISSTYFLNLNHPSFELQGKYAVTVHQAWIPEDKVFTHVCWLRADVLDYAQGARHPDSVTPISVARFLVGQRPRVYAVLQSMLYRYASFLLSHHWRALLPGAYLLDDRLYEMIKLDFRKPVLKLTGENVVAEQAKLDAEWVEIIEHFYTLTHEIAHEFRSRFGQATFLQFESAQMSVLPVADDLGYKVIAMVLRSTSSGAEGFVWLDESSQGVVTRRAETLESEVDLRNRYDFGLLTRPKRCPSKV